MTREEREERARLIRRHFTPEMIADLEAFLKHVGDHPEGLHLGSHPEFTQTNAGRLLLDTMIEAGAVRREGDWIYPVTLH